MKKIVVFASGSGTNAENIIQYFTQKESGTVLAVFTNNKNAGVIEKAKKYGVPTQIFSKEDLIKVGIKRLNSMTGFGVTTVEGKSGYGLDLDTEIKQLEVMKDLNKLHSLDIITTFLGPHARPEAYKKNPDAFIEFMIENAGMSSMVGGATGIPREATRMAMVVISTLPIALSYPFFQKYFISGLTIGGVKE